ncbi:hypothetical protein BJ684DRAFT_17461, partial [Piptocephalis cylindrospora]
DEEVVWVMEEVVDRIVAAEAPRLEKALCAPRTTMGWMRKAIVVLLLLRLKSYLSHPQGQSWKLEWDPFSTMKSLLEGREIGSAWIIGLEWYGSLDQGTEGGKGWEQVKSLLQRMLLDDSKRGGNDAEEEIVKEEGGRLEEESLRRAGQLGSMRQDLLKRVLSQPLFAMEGDESSEEDSEDDEEDDAKWYQ